MKKYLMTGIAALAMCAAFTSCSKDTEFEPLTQEQLDQQKAEQITLAYNQAFVKTFGQPASNQTWGFGTTTRAITRTADPGDGGAWFGPEQGPTYKAMGIVAPEMVSAEEEREVAKWFRENQYPTSDPIDLSTFFVQQVHFNHKTYNSSNSGHTNVGGDHMDWICAGSDEMGDDHINNFNANSPERYYVEGGWTNARDYMSKIMLMVNSSTQRFGYKESANTENKVYHTFVLKALYINGKWGYYVGFDYEAHGQNGNFNADGYYDDRIIKIVPGDGIVTPPSLYDGRIMAEDLCAQEGSDFDFNDVVFDWKVIENGAKAKIHLLAAGGTMSLRIGGTKENENSGVEVHAKFGVNPDIMVNTATDGAPKVVVKPYQDFEILASEANLNTFNANGSNIPIYVKKDGVWVELTAYTGAPAAKINCPVGTAWVDEYAKITWAYPNFAQYVNQPSIKWWESVNPTWVNLLLSDNTNPPTE